MSNNSINTINTKNSNPFNANKKNPTKSAYFVPISPVREQVKKFGESGQPRPSWKMYNEVERHMNQNKVSRNLSEWFKNPEKPYYSYVHKIVQERLKYDDWSSTGEEREERSFSIGDGELARVLENNEHIRTKKRLCK